MSIVLLAIESWFKYPTSAFNSYYKQPLYYLLKGGQFRANKAGQFEVKIHVQLPAESGDLFKRNFHAKYVVLFIAFFVWIFVDLLLLVFQTSDKNQELAAKSFKDTTLPIYGKVIFHLVSGMKGTIRAQLLWLPKSFPQPPMGMS